MERKQLDTLETLQLSDCEDQILNRKEFAKGWNGQVYRHSPRELTQLYGESVSDQVQAQASYVQLDLKPDGILVVKKVAHAKVHPDVQAQYKAGQLANGKERICVGIVPILGLWHCNPGSDYFVMPSLDDSLMRFLSRKDLTNSSQIDIKSFLLPNFMRITTALLACHSRGITHSDLSLANLLLSSGSTTQAYMCHYRGMDLLVPPSNLVWSLTDFGFDQSTSITDPHHEDRIVRDFKRWNECMYMILSFPAIRSRLPKKERVQWLVLLLNLGLDPEKLSEPDSTAVFLDTSVQVNETSASLRLPWNRLLVNRYHPLLAPYMGPNVVAHESWTVTRLSPITTTNVPVPSVLKRDRSQSPKKDRNTTSPLRTPRSMKCQRPASSLTSYHPMHLSSSSSIQPLDSCCCVLS